MRKTSVALFALMVACGTQAVTNQTDKPASAGSPSVNAPCDASTSDANTRPLHELSVQEWGTYTSVVAPDGHALTGMHHEDEALPTWVQKRVNLSKGTEVVEEPLQQLETPVLYFWSKEKRDVDVTVNFPDGLVSEWFPTPKSYLPAIGSATALAKGSMNWKVTLDPAWSPSKYTPVSPDEIWAPSRNVQSTPVVVGPESEQFIFYRGLGKFSVPIRVTIAADETISIRNDSDETVSEVFVLRFADGAGDVVSAGAVGARATLTTAAPKPTKSSEDYVTAARTKLRASLEKSGLKADVAQAMVDTWTKSWFRNTGLRVLYVAPRAWTDRWLPTSISPTPDEFVRTLVGRVELITVAEESDTLAKVKAHHLQFGGDTAKGQALVTSLGRFAEPRLTHAAAQIGTGREAKTASFLRSLAHQAP